MTESEPSDYLQRQYKEMREDFKARHNQPETSKVPLEKPLKETPKIEQSTKKLCELCKKKIPDDDLHKEGLCDECRSNPARREALEHSYNLIKEITPEELTEILSTTIKKDDITKRNVFYDILLTYTSNEQQNIGLIAGSSTGKSYIPIELAAYFPDEDLIKLGYASPTSFFHQWGSWQRDPRLPPLIEGLEEQEDEKEQFKRQQKENLTVVDLHQKILIFLDSPHSELLKNLRSLLSHDDKYIEQRITDRSQKGNKTKRILLIGFPTVVFCSANTNLDEQEKTRLSLYSPDSSQDKISEAITHKIQKSGNQQNYAKEIEENPERKLLKIRIVDIKQANFKNINISDELMLEIDNRFKEIHRTLQARHQRDISKLLAKIKACALLNYYNREYDLEKGTLEVNHDDVINGFAQYETYRESNELGLPPESYNTFIMLQDQFLGLGLTLTEYQREYFKIYKILLGRKRAENNLKDYTTVGLIIESPDPTDKRKTRYILSGVGVSYSNVKGEQTSNLDLTVKKEELVLVEEKVHTPTPRGIYLPKTAKDCLNHRQASCTFPNPDCLLPTNPCPQSCRDFKPSMEEMSSFENKEPTGEDT